MVFDDNKDIFIINYALHLPIQSNLHYEMTKLIYTTQNSQTRILAPYFHKIPQLHTYDTSQNAHGKCSSII